MKAIRVIVPTLLLAVSALALQPTAAADVAISPAGVARPANQVVLRAGTLSAPSLVPEEATVVASATAATFQVTYTGFTPSARAAFQRAVNVWAPLLNSTVPVTVNASFVPLGTNVLGSAGPGFFWRDFPGAPAVGTWYADAIANTRAGGQMDPSADVRAQFSSNFTNWHFGTGRAPAGSIDFTSVALHELGHGLGVLGAGEVTGSTGTVRLNATPRLPVSYDRFTENNVGRALLGFPDNSTQLANQLRSNSVYFDSTRVRNANGGHRAQLYAPTKWEQGSSYSHLNEATYPQGNANSLMTPVINFGETIRNPGPITRAILLTVGW